MQKYLNVADTVSELVSIVFLLCTFVYSKYNVLYITARQIASAYYLHYDIKISSLSYLPNSFPSTVQKFGVCKLKSIATPT